ncbi:hypothetical protein CONPUDRAFT_68639 [Coniophora puteana RWD-64-598 SS2]|uniref:Uncharacterized protein n=1 Tax=Coniophora puteana (strain RWD-64-598) TaxID=741705 RepID=A0A5M3N3R9_CONPW|nr:uncharacterized protein CONPUDRAFT_68639 [Coniophora puteana RWD-64-598 SS2]EIW86013.1 hypothetical protein CONPUDRAFT_68639 [Coniophora puteana RWD-64-598 SS2]
MIVSNALGLDRAYGPFFFLKKVKCGVTIPDKDPDGGQISQQWEDMSSAVIVQEIMQEAADLQRITFLVGADSKKSDMVNVAVCDGTAFQPPIMVNRSLTSDVSKQLRYLGIIYIMRTLGLSTFGKSLYLESVSQVLNLVIVMLLQGLMTLRVYVLLGKPKSICLALGILFAVTQITNIVSMLYYLTAGEKFWTDDEVLGFHYCMYNVSTNRAWTIPTSSISLLVFEIVLCGFILNYAVKNLSVSLWSVPAHATASLTWIIVRDNLVYFFIALATLLLSSINLIPIISEAINSVAEVTLLSMAGPRMIISLRKSYLMALESGTAGSNELTTVAFNGAAPSQAENDP